MKREYLKQKRQSLMAQSQKQYLLTTADVAEDDNGDIVDPPADEGNMKETVMVDDGSSSSSSLLQRSDEMVVIEGQLENRKRIRELEDENEHLRSQIRAMQKSDADASCGGFFEKWK